MRGELLTFVRDNKSGLIIPETVKRRTNAIQPHLSTFRASEIWNSTIQGDYDMDNLFTAAGWDKDETWLAANGRDGILLSDTIVPNTASPYDLATPAFTVTGTFPGDTYAFLTTLNAGGTVNTNYVEYKGVFSGAALDASDDNLYLCRGCATTGGEGVVANIWASYAGVTESIGSGESFYVYWKITFEE